MKIVKTIAVILLFLVIGNPSSIAGKLKVAALFFNTIKVPWNKAIYNALVRGRQDFNYTLSIVQNLEVADIPHILGKYARNGYNIIYADATGIERSARIVARKYPKVKFMFASENPPLLPNVSVFNDWIQEPAYLCGIIAAKLTKNGIVGVVGGYPLPEENRLINAFIQGVKDTDSVVKIRLNFTCSWFAPNEAKVKAIKQIEYGADIVYSETFGAIEACRERNVLAFGNITDQNYLAPNTVITGPLWNFYATVRLVTISIIANTWTSIDFRKWTSMKSMGAELAPFHGFAKKIPKKVLKIIKEREEEIKSGRFKVPINDKTPSIN